MAWLGKVVLSFFLEKVWGLLMKGVSALIDWARSEWAKWKQRRQIAKAKKAEEKYKEAEGKTGDERSKERADAACELEKALDPDSSCDRS